MWNYYADSCRQFFSTNVINFNPSQAHSPRKVLNDLWLAYTLLREDSTSVPISIHTHHNRELILHLYHHIPPLYPFLSCCIHMICYLSTWVSVAPSEQPTPLKYVNSYVANIQKVNRSWLMVLGGLRGWGPPINTWPRYIGFVNNSFS